MEERKEFDESIVKENPDTEIPAEEMPDSQEVPSQEAPEEVSEEVSVDEKETSGETKAGKKENKTSGKKKTRAALEIELKKIGGKLEETTDRYQRLLAEFENARKRNAKEQSHMYDVGAKAVLEKLLPVVDNFERGLAVLSEEEKEEPFAQGMIKIYQQMMTSLSELGVSPMDPVGKEFNPDFHNAVMHEENEELGDNIVAEEFQKGYMFKDSVLRYSMVKVVN